MNLKTIISSIILILILSNCEKSDKKENTLKKIDINGQVTSIELKSYLAIEKFGEVENGKREIEYSWLTDYKTVFNEYGYIIEKNWYDTNDKLTGKTIVKYDDDFNEIENNHYNPNGSLTEKTVFKYDKNGNNIENIGYNSYGDLKNTFISKYNSLNQVIEEKYLDSAQNVFTQNKYKYDSDQNRVEDISYYKGNFDDKRIMEYNNKNQLTSLIVFDSTNNILQKRILIYDKNELLKEVNHFDANGKLIRKEKFEYDYVNNWIRKIIYDELKPTFVIIRTIEYKK